IVRKTVFSDKHRLVFVAGLEGTGHHYFYQALGLCVQWGSCESSCSLSKSFYPRMGAAESVVNFGNALANVRNHLRAAKKREQDLAPGEGLVLPLNCLTNCSSGMMSYPLGETHFPTQHPNLRHLAELAEDADLDLRIVYLTRNAEGILSSTVVNRGFGTYMHHGRSLVANAFTLRNQLAMVDPAFIMCFRVIGEAGDPSAVARLAEFITP
ncbi:unnamed protein product, partial [Choristocarpus tenellus]